MRALLTLCAVLVALPAVALADDHADRWFLVQLEPGSVLPSGQVMPAVGALRDAAVAADVERFEALVPVARHPALRAHGLDRMYRVVLRAPSADVQAVVETWRGLPGVELVGVDHRGQGGGIPNDPVYPQQWGLNNTGGLPGAVAGADIGAEAAWDLVTGSGVQVIAILDTGLNLLEPDLPLWTNPGEIAGNAIDDDANGYVDDVLGWDFAYNDRVPSDFYGHGSNVGSVAGALGGNGRGVSGVCQDCRLMAAKNLDDTNSGWYSWWISSIAYAVDNGATVINMSEGGTGNDALLEAAVSSAHAAGIPVIACMMNTNNATRYYPAAYADSIAVGATDVDDDRASPFSWGGGSNYGSHIDLVAPGNEIVGASPTVGDFSWTWGGTSQATPHVTGAVALMLDLDPTMDVETIRSYLHTSSADGVGAPAEDRPGFDNYMGWGRLDLAALVDATLVGQYPLSLVCDPFVGATASCGVQGVTPGAQVGLVGGTSTGAGTCPPQLGGACLNVSGTVRLADQGAAGPGGGALLTVPRPPLPSGTTIWIQAAAVGAKSQPVPLVLP